MYINLNERNGLVLTNTWFKKPKRRLYTWKAPEHQLDYVFVKHRLNSTQDVQTMLGADIDSQAQLTASEDLH
jgi:hypothetical protein